MKENIPEWLRDSTRSSLIVAIIFTIINILFFVLNYDTYFLFSIFVPYILPIIFQETSLYIVSIGISVFILLIYITLIILSKKNVMGYTISLILYIIDTLALIILGIIYEMTGELIIDYIFHGFIIWILIKGIKNYKNNLKKEAIKENNNISEE